MNFLVQFFGEIILEYLDDKSGGKVSKTLDSAASHVEKKHDQHMKKVEKRDEELEKIHKLVKSQNLSYDTLKQKYPGAGGYYKLALGKEIKERNVLINEHVKKIESGYYSVSDLHQRYESADGELKIALKYVIQKQINKGEI
ncbi:hypothetical protein EVJ20_12970 [Exiguobacterium sp. SH0S1]|uniref:hypothetical protein n=1 Tax=Exiguobacterium sp. SH0S1 TaxID=2510949 RepID=UPI00103AAEC4|nr:hypothetical protein [Exiguobacterium sp. SH0S1]TCI75885.1 hypothetical protein EVJ20_12970 [Exiguobacterium sp. SH0S1]